MLTGFRYASYQKDKVPFDFETDDVTGLRPNEKVPPSKWLKHDLTAGIEDAILPPDKIWYEGKWLDAIPQDKRDIFFPLVKAHEVRRVFITSGEYTPGNYLMRLYVLPNTIAEYATPPHPLDWEDHLRRGRCTTSYQSAYDTAVKPTTGPQSREWDSRDRYGYGFGYGSPPPPPAPPKPVATTPAKPAAPKGPAIPHNVKMRCGGCGHWFKDDTELGGHARWCCPAINGKDSDWAVMCQCCDHLDDVATIKPGFPRPKKKPVAKKPTTAAKPAAKPAKPDAQPALPAATEAPAATETHTATV